MHINIIFEPPEIPGTPTTLRGRTDRLLQAHRAGKKEILESLLQLDPGASQVSADTIFPVFFVEVSSKVRFDDIRAIPRVLPVSTTTDFVLLE